jgi:Protein of unknown function (DUF429)
MKIFGLDFTSAPTKRKPITIAECDLERRTLRVVRIRLAADFETFEAQLQIPGPWVAGFDFPFGLPLEFLQAAGLPLSWGDYVATIARGGKEKFEFAVNGFIASQPELSKHPRRVTDKLAGSTSPLNIVNPPVGKMFFAGAPRLLASGISVQPCCPSKNRRVALETYPALAARALTGDKRPSYKSDSTASDSESKAGMRRNIAEALGDSQKMKTYGLTVAMTSRLRNDLVNDNSGDKLDAVLCAIQAAWAYKRRKENWGIPAGHENEGWIVNPECSESQASHAENN